MTLGTLLTERAPSKTDGEKLSTKISKIIKSLDATGASFSTAEKKAEKAFSKLRSEVVAYHQAFIDKSKVGVAEYKQIAKDKPTLKKNALEVVATIEDEMDGAGEKIQFINGLPSSFEGNTLQVALYQINKDLDRKYGSKG